MGDLSAATAPVSTPTSQVPFSAPADQQASVVQTAVDTGGKRNIVAYVTFGASVIAFLGTLFMLLVRLGVLS